MDHLVSDILASSDRVYGVPGYPVTRLIQKTGAELVINEKVALEYALGDSLAGRRACVIVKHVGVNALADPLAHATFQGLKAGVVLLSGDDPVAANTLTVQDSRCYGPVAGIPVLAPGPASPFHIRDAYTASERYSRIALVRMTPESMETYSSCPESPDGRNAVRPPGSLADPGLTMYGRAKQAAEGYPLMAEEGLIPGTGQYPPPAPLPGNPVSRHDRGTCRTLCRECPYHMLFALLRDLGKEVICDTGCSLLAMNPPYGFGLACYGMGSAAAVAARSVGIALTGDGALFHSGLQALIDARKKAIPLLCIVMQNRCMGMTGGQPVGDIIPYLKPFDPLIIDASDVMSIASALMSVSRLRVIVVQGRCPEVICHETVEC
jgi:TPP-dependent indolepyruvate ferredoxin oxidoreductase alpha subunit